jgi:hypothetical protein
MSHATIMNRAQLFAAATAITAVGFLTVPTPARAGPMLPLAPPCSQYVFTGGFSLREDAGNRFLGVQTFFSSTGPTTVGGRAVSVSDDNVHKDLGNVSGGIQGRKIDFTITWDDGRLPSHYTGTVGDDGLVHRGVSNYGPDPIGWDSINGPLNCGDPVAPPPPKPAPGPIIGETLPAQRPSVDRPTVATVTGDVDVYDVPGGNGTKIGILRSGNKYKLATDNGLPAANGQTCKKPDWCHLVIPEVKGSNGWVWDDPFLQFGFE